MQLRNSRPRYSEHGYRKFFTVTDTDTGEKFCALCEAFDQSIYKRLRNLIETDIEANREIIDDILGLKKKKEEPEESNITRTEKTVPAKQPDDLITRPPHGTGTARQENVSKKSDDDFWRAFGLKIEPSKEKRANEKKVAESEASDDDFWSLFK